MADPVHKSELAVQPPPPKPESHGTGDGVTHDSWSQLSSDIFHPSRALAKLEVRAALAGAQLAVDATELYAKAFPPETEHLLYKSTDAVKSIHASDVLQGGVNDCFFMASLAAVADSAPKLIVDAIKANADGSYTVTFPGAKGSPVQTPKLTADELSAYAKDSPDGVWPAVMEKAFGIYLRDHPDEKDKILGRSAKGFVQSISNWLDNDIFDSFKAPQELADGGEATACLNLLTGYQPGGLPLMTHDVGNAKSTLAGAFIGDEKLPTVAAIAENNQDALRLGLHTKHAYTVLGYHNGIVTLRDPNGITVPNEQGNAMVSKNGVFDMKIEDFAKAYDELYTGRLTQLWGGGGAIMGFNKRIFPKEQLEQPPKNPSKIPLKSPEKDL